jgi:MFS family permease
VTQFPAAAPGLHSGPHPGPPKTCGHAIAGLAFGLAGLCTCGVGGIVGLVLGIAALREIAQSRGRIRGRGLAIAAILVSAASIVLGFVVGVLFLLMVTPSEVADWVREFWESIKESDDDEFISGPDQLLGLPLPSFAAERAGAGAVRLPSGFL